MSVNDYNDDLYLAIQEIALDEKSAEYGIAMKVVHEGYESLSAKQRYVYDTQVVPLLREQARLDEFNRLYDPD